MPAKASLETKTRIVRQKQKNGDIYVLERQVVYDPDKKYYRVLSSRLLSKIPKGTDQAVPTRPKRKPGEKVSLSRDLQASRQKVGMMDIVDHLGRVSGIDDALYGNTDLGTAQKAISVARYLFANNGQTLPGITTWQFNHPLPYEEGISEDIYHDLFVNLGRDESLQQNFFASRLQGIHDKVVLAYDSTTISTYSRQLPDARYGFNKAGDSLKTVKVLTLYSIETRQPIAFAKQPGNLPDVTSIENALAQLSALGIQKAEIVMDNGYYSEQNLADMLYAHFDFITLSKVSVRWIRKELRKHLGEFSSTSSGCPFDPSTHGVCVVLTHEFSHIRKKGSQSKGLEAGSIESFSRRVYLHLFFNPVRRAEEDVELDRQLFELKQQLESGIQVDELSETGQKRVKTYLQLAYRGGKLSITFNEKAIQQVKEEHGYFALIASSEKDSFECLRKYRQREHIESFFECGKQRTDGSRTRAWSDEALRGRLFIQFVSLCYYEYFAEAVRKLKTSLGVRNGDPNHDLSEILTQEKKLKSWIDNTPLYLQLHWFDTVEEVRVSSKLRAKRWNTEVTLRDQIYLDKLGVPRR